MLNMLERFDPVFLSTASLHQIEANGSRSRTRARYYADPAFAKIPIEWPDLEDYAAGNR